MSLKKSYREVDVDVSLGHIKDALENILYALGVVKDNETIENLSFKNTAILDRNTIRLKLKKQTGVKLTQYNG